MFKFILITIQIALTIKMASSYFKCTTDGFFPDKTDCWVYHICDGGTHSVRACEEDLFFNPKTGLCDWPMNVDCKQSSTKLTTKNAIKTTKKPSADKSTDKSSDKSSLDDNSTAGGDKNASGEAGAVENSSVEQQSICAPEDYGYMQHPKDCRKYIYCQEGQSKVFTCQGGLLWKQSEGNCVWPLDSDCPSLLVKKTASNGNNMGGGGGAGGGGGGGGGGGYNSQLPTSAQSLAALRELYGTIECPIDITGFLPNPYDCSAYHFCNAGKDQVILCEPGLVYRQEKQVCDWPVNSQCQNKCPASSTSPASPATKDSVKYRFVDSKSCCRYFECVNGRLVPQLCQYPLLFDMYTKQCLDYSRVKCGIRKECLSPCQYFSNEDNSLCEMVPQCAGKPQGIYLDQNRPNCQFFYTCRDNRVFNHTRCSGNLRFNQYEGRCMAPNLVQCTSHSAPAHPSSSTLFSLTLLISLLATLF